MRFTSAIDCFLNTRNGAGAFLGRHERRVNHKRIDANVQQIGNRRHGIKRHTVEQVTSPKHVGNHGEIVALSVVQRMRAQATFTLRTLLVARALAHQQTVLGNHHFLRAAYA